MHHNIIKAESVRCCVLQLILPEIVTLKYEKTGKQIIAIYSNNGMIVAEINGP